MDLTLRVITPDVFDVERCDPHLVEFSPDRKRLTLRGDVIVGRDGQLRIKEEYTKVSRQHCLISVHRVSFMHKQWRVTALDKKDFAVWITGVIIRLNRDGIGGTF